nr:EOG090X0AXR [Triops cancriformis]
MVLPRLSLLFGHIYPYKSPNLPLRYCTSMAESSVRYLTQAEAIQLDEELFNECQFSVDQLMELAGLSCAIAIAKQYHTKMYPKVLICVGPGNNGGDGLVCARHLKLFGFLPKIFYPKRPAKPLYQNLTKQCEVMQIPLLDRCPTLAQVSSTYDVVVDALFGFSFKPPVRKEFAEIMEVLHQLEMEKVPICSIDIPSGWDFPSCHEGPTAIITWSIPKKCLVFFIIMSLFLISRFKVPRLSCNYQNDRILKYRILRAFVSRP